MKELWIEVYSDQSVIKYKAQDGTWYQRTVMHDGVKFKDNSFFMIKNDALYINGTRMSLDKFEKDS